MQEVLLNTYLTILPIVTTSIMGYAVFVLQEQRKEHKKIKESKDAVAIGTQALLRDKLMFYYDKYMQRGSIPSYTCEVISEMFDAYQTLGGNGVVKHMIEDLKKLPIETKKEK